MSQVSAPRVNTIGQISTRLKCSVHQVAYVLRTRPHIQPTAIAGTARLFTEDQVAMIRHELNAIAARRVHKSIGVENSK